VFKKFAVGMAVALATLSLAACSPSEMSKAEAGKAYLEAVCPGNMAMKWDKSKHYNYKNTINFFNKVLVNDKAEAQKLDSPEKPWPKNVAAKVQLVVDATYGEIAELQALVKSTNYYDLTNWKSADMGTAPQTIRGRLGLDTDSRESCKAYKAIGAADIAADLTTSMTYIEALTGAEPSIQWNQLNALGGLGNGYLQGYQTQDNVCQISEYDTSENAANSPMRFGRQGYVVDLKSGNSLAVTSTNEESECYNLVYFMLDTE
jgi:hypothetical protein